MIATWYKPQNLLILKTFTHFFKYLALSDPIYIYDDLITTISVARHSSIHILSKL